MKYIITFILALSLSSCDKFSDIQGVTMSSVCQNLHKVEDVDDLLKQFYDNIDSHCLFEMDTKELERIWGIRVFDLRVELGTKNSPERWQYNEKGNGIYLVRFNNKDIDNFQVFTTELYQQTYHSGWGNSFLSKGKLTTIPKYDLKEKIQIQDHAPILTKEYIDSLPETDFDSLFTDYIWLNKEKSANKPSLVLSTADKTIPNSITLFKNNKI